MMMVSSAAHVIAIAALVTVSMVLGPRQRPQEVLMEISLAGAVETRLKACVLAGGGNLDGPGEYWDRSKPMCQGLPYQALRFLGDRAAVIYALHAARGPTLIFNGLEDTTVQVPPFGEAGFAALQARVRTLRGSATGVFETGFVPGAGHRPWFVTKPVVRWLEQQLDFPAWTLGDIDAMPETHIGPWAQANGVEMDKLYATEHREGGTRAPRRASARLNGAGMRSSVQRASRSAA